VTAAEFRELGPDHFGDASGVEGQLAVSGCLGEERVIDPNISHEVGGLLRRLDPLSRAEDLSQPLGRQLLAACFSRDVRVNGEQLTGALAPGCKESAYHHTNGQSNATHLVSK
jgi:hypothetical protein